MSFSHDDSLIVRTWYEIAAHAIEARASDIHVEVSRTEMVVRIRVDGSLTVFSHYPLEIHERLITRIKILARLDIAEKRLPQDGHLSIGLDFANPNIDCRVSVLPTLYGEKAVIRILPNRIEELALEKIGLLPDQLAVMERALQEPNGLILVTGPTGSGKTRTLYSCLNALNQSHRNLCSIEDPVEIRLPGINQVAYHPRAGLDFPVIIKALLRQDPDVIMIGEIRDKATAELAIQAAQTGHLVLSTLHTRNARGVLPRLKSLGVDQEALESSLRCVSSQRLVPMLCRACKAWPHQDRFSCGVCNGNGYLGRIGIHEILTIEQLLDPDIPFKDIAKAGLSRLEEGIIDRIAFEAEVGAWH